MEVPLTSTPLPFWVIDTAPFKTALELVTTSRPRRFRVRHAVPQLRTRVVDDDDARDRVVLDADAVQRERRAALSQNSISGRFLNRQAADGHARDTVDHHEAVEFRIGTRPDTSSIDDGGPGPGQRQHRRRDQHTLVTGAPHENRLSFPCVLHRVSERLPAVTVDVLDPMRGVPGLGLRRACADAAQ